MPLAQINAFEDDYGCLRTCWATFLVTPDMVFLSICTALYDYVPQSENELALQEGDLIYVLEKSTEDDWWRAKKRAQADEDEEPTGLIPNNYVEEARPTHHAKALYDYDRQTDEEVSFTEDTVLSVYDYSDPDWTLVGLHGEFGFAPANYIEITGEVEQSSPVSASSPQISRNQGPEPSSSPTSAASPPQDPAAALAGIMANKAISSLPAKTTATSSVAGRRAHPRPQYTPEESDEEVPPSLPRRPPSQQRSPPSTHDAIPMSPGSPGGVAPSPPYNRVTSQKYDDDRGHPSPGGFHLYNISEMVSPAIGKKKKLPTTLGLNLATGVIMIAPEKSRDGPQQEWSAEKLTNYSIEGKHVFMELVRPSKNVDFHAGATDTAQEIVAGLGEIAGAARAEGLREVLEIGAGQGGQKKGQVLYDFVAQGDDEVTVAIGDDVVVLDDSKSEEWWMVRRLKNGKEGVVPSSYVEITGTTAPTSVAGLDAGRSVVEQNRLEEERLTRAATKTSRNRAGSGAKGSEVGPGVKLPQRGSSLANGDDSNRASSQKTKRSSKDAKSGSNAKSSEFHGLIISCSANRWEEPDSAKIRTWTDRSGSFKVDAQFIGLKDGKIHLHKLNGVKIAVPVGKMAVEDLEYVERVTGQSLDDEKPLSDIRRRGNQGAAGHERKKSQTSAPKSGASIQQGKPQRSEHKVPEYDWFDFFLKAGVNPYQCERYAFNFNKDSMDESILPDITPSVLRTLGLKEGDILRVMKHLDSKFGRTGSKLKSVSYGDEAVSGDASREGVTSPEGGLFSGSGGALRNNTRKGRPAPAVQSNDVVNAQTLKQGGNREKSPEKNVAASTPILATPPPQKASASGFDDDAIWNVKPSKKERNDPLPPQPIEKPSSSAPSQQVLSGSMAELSLLSPPLQPTPAQNTDVPQLQQVPPQVSQQNQPPALALATQSLQQPTTSANSTFLTQAGQQQTSVNGVPHNASQPHPLSSLNQPQTYPNTQQSQQISMPRQRPQAPPQVSQVSGILSPPPRPLSAPQTQNNNIALPPLQPQLTGFQPSSQQTQIAPPGQSMNELNQMRFQQQQHQFNQPYLYPQQTGYGQQNQGLNQYPNAIPSSQTGFGQQQQFQPLQPQQTAFQGFQNAQPFNSGQQVGNVYVDPRSQSNFQALQPQITGSQGQVTSGFSAQRTGSVNSYLQPALQPQITGINSLQGRENFGQTPPPPPSIPQEPVGAAPLQPQKTGPAPPVSFGAPAANRLTAQPTGKRANLSQASHRLPSVEPARCPHRLSTDYEEHKDAILSVSLGVIV
ncbi:MAG: hypothetical protein Q9167_005284 [Letrouitia subvulpina]